MRKRTRDDVEDQLREMINSYRLGGLGLPVSISVTRSDYSLLSYRDVVTGDMVRPKVFMGVQLRVI